MAQLFPRRGSQTRLPSTDARMRGRGIRYSLPCGRTRATRNALRATAQSQLPFAVVSAGSINGSQRPQPISNADLFASPTLPRETCAMSNIPVRRGHGNRLTQRKIENPRPCLFLTESLIDHFGIAHLMMHLLFSTIAVVCPNSSSVQP